MKNTLILFTSSYVYPRFGKHESRICLFVTSTFGNGGPPKMAEKTAEWIDKKMTHNDSMVNLKVFQKTSKNGVK
jgi:hypothetical protein